MRTQNNYRLCFTQALYLWMTLFLPALVSNALGQPATGASGQGRLGIEVLPPFELDLERSRQLIRPFELDERRKAVDPEFTNENTKSENNSRIERYSKPVQGTIQRVALEDCLATVSGRVLRKEATSTPWGKHRIVTIENDSGETFKLDFGPNLSRSDSLSINEPVIAAGFTATGAVDEGIIILAFGETVWQESRINRRGTSLSGKVVDAVIGPIGEHQHLRVTIETDNNLRVLVELGATAKLIERPNIGDMISIDGCGGEIDSRSWLVASSFRILERRLP